MMMKKLPIFMRKTTRETARARIENGNLGRKCEMIKKYRDNQRLIIKMDHMDLKLAWQIYLTLSSSAYLNVLKLIDLFFKELLLRAIITHKGTQQEGNSRYNLVKNG